ncbi:MAG: hypothetical protein JWQ30_242 [Sediminibacterium sp.]|nr:hypothetical protein [Sediminibacterium sp.]
MGKVNYSQEQKIRLIEGIYSGGICTDNAICGYWLIKKDSTFIFVDFNKDDIKYIGYGSWRLSADSLIILNFKDSLLPILDKSKAEYFSKTVPAFDSVYISGTIKDQNGAAVSYASIIINQKYTIISDVNGYYKFSYPRKGGVQRVSVIKKIDGYIPFEFELSPNNNDHVLNITLPLVDSATALNDFHQDMLISSQTSNLELKINMGLNKKHTTLSLHFETRDKNFLLLKLITSSKRQPYLGRNINELIELAKR